MICMSNEVGQQTEPAATWSAVMVWKKNCRLSFKIAHVICLHIIGVKFVAFAKTLSESSMFNKVKQLSKKSQCSPNNTQSKAQNVPRSSRSS